MLNGYAVRDHYGIDQAKEGFIMAPETDRSGTAERGTWKFASRRHRFAPGTLRHRGRDAHAMLFSFRKEVIQPQVLLRLPCYDFTPIMNYTLGGCPLAVGSPTSSATHFRDVTGGVYKARERIHRGILIRDY